MPWELKRIVSMTKHMLKGDSNPNDKYISSERAV